MSDLNQHGLYGDANPKPGDQNKVDTVEMLSARKAALSLLEDVLVRKQALDHALETNQNFKPLMSRDRAFARMIVSTTLRRLGQINDLITRMETSPNSSKNMVLQNILRIGVAQICFMEVPDHAAVDTSVRLADAAEMDRQKAFVNGLLRNIARTGRDIRDKQDEARVNTPEWLLKLWISDYGLKEAAEIANANLVEAPLDFSIKDQNNKKYWEGALQARETPSGSLRRTAGGAVNELIGFDDGMWWVQDAAAAIPATLFGDVVSQPVIDMCAAPGGKTAQLAAMGAHVTALDRSAKRLKRLQANLKRLRLEQNVQTLTEDASAYRPKEQPQFILLDAPCSATGTIRRHPDVMHLKTETDLERLISIQWRILENAISILAPGGTLIYCTCSLQKAEGEYQIERALNTYPEMVRKPIDPAEIGNMDDLVNEHGDVRILPYHMATQGGMDGFFIARLTKN